MQKQHGLVLVGCLLALSLSVLIAGEAPVPPEQIAKWVKQLGADDFNAREEAEEKLAKAGIAALAELKKGMAANDPEIRTRSARLAEKLKWIVLPDITDLTAILPADNLFYVGTPSVKKLVERIRKETPFGQLYDRADMAPLRDVITQAFVDGSGLGDDGRKTIENWFDRFGGPAGLALMKINNEQQNYHEREQVAFFLGINDPDPKKAMADFLKMAPLGGETLRKVYRGVPCELQQGEWQRDGLAQLKNIIVRSTNHSAMYNVIDGILDSKTPKLNSAALYKEACAGVDGEPLGTLFFNMEAMYNSVFTGERDKSIAAGFGFSEWKYAIVTLSIKDGLFHEQAFCKVEGERRGLAQLLSLKPVSGRLATLCPPNALAFVSIPGDGKAIYESIINMTREVDRRETEQFEKMVAEMDKKLGVSIVNDLIGSLNGETALWLIKRKDPTKAPDTCIVLEASDAAAAKKAADTFAKLIPQLTGKEDAVGKAEYKGRTCYFIKPVEKRNRWEPELVWAWCADESRILIGQRQETLQQMILRVSKESKGLAAQADFQKLLKAIPEKERGGLAYINMREVLTWGYTVGLPALTANAPEDAKAKLAKAPKDPKELFKDMTGTLLSVRRSDDGVRARAVGGAPATGVVMGVPALIFVNVAMAMDREMVRAAAVVEEVEVEKAAEEEVEEEKAEPAKKNEK